MPDAPPRSYQALEILAGRNRTNGKEIRPSYSETLGGTCNLLLIPLKKGLASRLQCDHDSILGHLQQLNDLPFAELRDSYDPSDSSGKSRKKMRMPRRICPAV